MSFANAEETNTSDKESLVPTKSVGKQNTANPDLYDTKNVSCTHNQMSYSLNKSTSDVKKTLGSSEGERMKRKRKSRWGRVSQCGAVLCINTKFIIGADRR